MRLDAYFSREELETIEARLDPVEDKALQERLAKAIDEFADEDEGEDEDTTINPAACPECKSTNEVEAHGWVFARYSLDIGEDGSLDYPPDAEIEWDMCKPFQEMPPIIAEISRTAGVEYLHCSGCDVDWWYRLPDDNGPGRSMGLA